MRFFAHVEHAASKTQSGRALVQFWHGLFGTIRATFDTVGSSRDSSDLKKHFLFPGVL